MRTFPFLVALFGLLTSIFPPPTSAADLKMIAPNIPPHFDAAGTGRIGDVVKATLKA